MICRTVGVDKVRLGVAKAVRRVLEACDPGIVKQEGHETCHELLPSAAQLGSQSACSWTTDKDLDVAEFLLVLADELA